MRNLIAFLLMIAVLPASAWAAHTPITKGMANAYYQNCIARDDDRMSDEAQNSLCSCASARMLNILTVEDVMAMKKQPGPGRIEYNKMLTQIYSPCLQAPIEETLYGECMRDRKVTELYLRDPARLCHCTSVRSARYLEDNVGNLMSYLLQGNPEMTDPLPIILGDSSFRQHAYDSLYACLKE